MFGKTKIVNPYEDYQTKTIVTIDYETKSWKKLECPLYLMDKLYISYLKCLLLSAKNTYKDSKWEIYFLDERLEMQYMEVKLSDIKLDFWEFTDAIVAQRVAKKYEEEAQKLSQKAKELAEKSLSLSNFFK